MSTLVPKLQQSFWVTEKTELGLRMSSDLHETHSSLSDEEASRKSNFLALVRISHLWKFVHKLEKKGCLNFAFEACAAKLAQN